MKTLTDDEFRFLSDWEDRLESATTSTYIRAVPTVTVHRMREIYSRLIDTPYSMNEHCGSCVLKLCKNLYKPYYDYKQIKGNSTGCSTESEQDT